MSTEEFKVDGKLLARAGFGLLVVLGVAALAGILLREPIEAVAGVFIDRFGWAGLFAGVVITDASPIPMTHEPILLLGVAEGLNAWKIGVVASLASVCAGPVGYTGGWLLRTRSDARHWLEDRAPGMVRFLRDWGATGVAIAALLPIPYALATWTAGLLGVRFAKVVLASLLRIPKTLFYLFLIVQGWSLGTG